MPHNLLLAFDIGGTKLAVGMAPVARFRQTGTFDALVKEPIPLPGTPDVVTQRLVKIGRQLLDESNGQLAGIGISIGGPLDHLTGTVLNFPHLPGWRNIPLRQQLSEDFGAPAGLVIQGSVADFDRDQLNEKYMVQVAPKNAMHPVLPLRLKVAWADFAEKNWDSLDGSNYMFEFNMRQRGWDNFLGVGISPNPHGGIGFLEYRNLFSNYGRYASSGELGRSMESWNFNAFGNKNHLTPRENFMAVDYMDLHILKPGCGIGLHRHRDNQEVFMMMEGRGLMVVGDWCKLPERERCLEIRTLLPGNLAMLKGGQLHGLMNLLDEDASLFMFGGYD